MQNDGPHGFIMVHKALSYGQQGLDYDNTWHIQVHRGYTVVHMTYILVHANYIMVRRIYIMKHKALHYGLQGL